MKTTNSITITRIISAVVALPVYFFAIITDMFHAVPILVVSLAVTGISLYEFYQIGNRGENGRPFLYTGIAAGIVINFIMYLFVYGSHIERFDARIILGVMCFLLAVLFTQQLFMRPIKGGAYSISITLAGLIYIVIPFAHIIFMKALSDGIFYIMVINIIIMVNDSAAYFGGVYLGRHKTDFAVSPNKSWEGYASGLIFSVLGMLALNAVYASFFDRHLFTMVEAGILGGVLSILGNIGDLIESAFKRDGAIKDSGSIIPGHGGMLDVFDAMIFTIPLFYYYLVLKGVS